MAAAEHLRNEAEYRLELVSKARNGIRDVERLCYRLVADAEGIEEVDEARGLLRLAVGLRRKLDDLAGSTKAVPWENS